MRDTARESAGNKNKRWFGAVHSVSLLEKIECTVSRALFRSMEIQIRVDETSRWNFYTGKLRRLSVLEENARKIAIIILSTLTRLLRDRCVRGKGEEEGKRAIFQRLSESGSDARTLETTTTTSGDGDTPVSSFFFFFHRGEEHSRRSQDGVARAREKGRRKKEDLSPFDF